MKYKYFESKELDSKEITKVNFVVIQLIDECVAALFTLIVYL